jgi:predicted RNA-binding protein with PUA-like domain
MNYWLVKTDPDTYSWDDFAKEKKTSWDGVRNFAARNHLQAMKRGDEVLVYHSGGESAVLGLAKVTKEAFHDPTTDEEAWFSVELAAGKKLKNLVTLTEIKKNSRLKEMLLLKISRLSVMPVKKTEYDEILLMSERASLKVK